MGAANGAHVSDTEQLVGFYEETYSRDPAAALRGARWRALGARGKAAHVIALCARAGLEPASTLEVGCGDGAVLSALHTKRFGGRLAGVEIAQGAVEIARERTEIDVVELYDGERLAMPDGAFDLGILSHVLEHVPAPAPLLAEVARVCGAVVVEVPLEDNLSARRPSSRAHSAEVGHLRRLSRRAVHALVAEAELRVAGELEDPLPLEVHRFFARGPLARARASVRWGVRAGLHRLAPGVARRAFTVHYACLCLPVEARS
ncbi:MAG: class I SAM-dependent methyltransferase [Solirubrobacterales bacterium]